MGSLSLTLGGAAGESTWATLPALDSLRRALIDATYLDPSSVSATDKGLGIMAVGSVTDAFNVCVGLRADVDTVASETRLGVGDIYDRLEMSLGYVSPAFEELRRLQVPQPYLDYVQEYVYGGSPLYIVSGIATLVTLAAILFA